MGVGYFLLPMAYVVSLWIINHPPYTTMARLQEFWLVVAVVFHSSPAFAGVKYPDCTSGPLKFNVVCDTKVAPEARASALVAAMSNSGKLANLVK